MLTWILIGFTLLLFFCSPFPVSLQQQRILIALSDLSHLPVLFLAATLLFWKKRNIWKTIIILSVLSALAEWIQPFFGRSRAFYDFLMGLSGIWLALLIYRLVLAKHLFHKALYVLLIILLLLVSVWPVVEILFDRHHLKKQYPVLAPFESPRELTRWSLNGCQLTLDREIKKTSAGLVRITTNEIRYPGLFLTDLYPNWKGFVALEFEIYWPYQRETNIFFRLDDLPGNPPYAERFQKTFTLNPGWNQLLLEEQDTKKTPSGRFLNFNNIDKIGLFFDRPSVGTQFYIDNVHLKVRPSI